MVLSVIDQIVFELYANFGVMYFSGLEAVTRY